MRSQRRKENDYNIVVEKPLNLEPLMVNVKTHIPVEIRLLIAELGGLSLEHSLTREQMHVANQVEMRRLALEKCCKDNVKLLLFVVVIIIMQILRLHVVVVALGVFFVIPAVYMTNRIDFIFTFAGFPLFVAFKAMPSIVVVYHLTTLVMSVDAALTFEIGAVGLWSTLATVLGLSIVVGLKQRHNLPEEPVGLVHVNCTTGEIGLFTSTPHLDERVEKNIELRGRKAFRKMRFQPLGYIASHNVRHIYVAFNGIHIVFKPSDILHKRLKLDDRPYKMFAFLGLHPHTTVDSDGFVHLNACFNDKARWSSHGDAWWAKLMSGPWRNTSQKLYRVRNASRPTLIIS